MGLHRKVASSKSLLSNTQCRFARPVSFIVMLECFPFFTSQTRMHERRR